MPSPIPPLQTFDKGHSVNMREFLLPALTATGCRIWCGSKIETVGDGFIEITTDTGLKQTVLCDSVVDVCDLQPDKEVLSQIGQIEAYAIGDCDVPYNIAEAIAAGNLCARKI
jgi:hypothetical protein